jgi:hypothetical protein
MATLKQKIAVERKMRELIETENLPEPDWIEYGYTCVRVVWERPKLCVVIDIDEAPEGFEKVGEQLRDGVEMIDRIRNAEVDGLAREGGDPVRGMDLERIDEAELDPRKYAELDPMPNTQIDRNRTREIDDMSDTD